MCLALSQPPPKTQQQCSHSISTHNSKTRYSMAWCRQDVRHFFSRDRKLVASERLFGCRERKRKKWQSPTQKKKTKWENKIPKKKKCGWGPCCPLCKAQRKEANPPHQQESMESQQQQKPLPKLQARRPNTLNVSKTKQQWEQEMERLNEKPKLDTFSNLELDSKSDEDEQYQYQHGYETLI